MWIKRLITKVQREIWLRRGDRRGLMVDSPEDAPTPSRTMSSTYWVPIVFGDIRGPYALHDTISWIVDRRWVGATVLRPTVRYVCQPTAGSEAVIGVAIVGACGGGSCSGGTRAAEAQHDGRIPLRATVAEVPVWQIERLEQDDDALEALKDMLAAALARQTDDLIVRALSQARTVSRGARVGMTENKVLAARDMLLANIGSDEGDVFAVVGRQQWHELRTLPEFDQAPRVRCEPDYMARARAKLWHGMRWLVHDHLPLVDGVRVCFVYHRRAVGHAIAEGVVTQIVPSASCGHVVRCTMRQGARLLDGRCVVAVPCREGEVS